MDREGELRRAGWRLVGATSRTHWRWIALALVSALFWTATKVTIPLLAAAAIDKGIIGNDTSELVKYVGLMLAVGSFQVVVSGLRRYGAFRLAFRVETDLRHRLFAHLQRLHFAFHDEAQTGQLMARANTDIQMVREFLMLAPLTAASLMILVAVTVVMLTQSVTLALLALGALPLLNVAAARFSKKMGPISFELQQELGGAVGRRRGVGVRHPGGEGLRRRGPPARRGSTSKPTRCRRRRWRRRGCGPGSCPSSTSCPRVALGDDPLVRRSPRARRRHAGRPARRLQLVHPHARLAAADERAC